MANTKTTPRLKALYNDKIAKELKTELGLDNINQVPKLEKVVISSGVGKKREDKKFTETVELTLTKITGQLATDRLAKKSIAGPPHQYRFAPRPRFPRRQPQSLRQAGQL